MINSILENYGLYILIGLGVLVLIVIIILIVSSIKKKPVEEDNSSILDVNIDGVVEGDFKYGYEKEDTIVIKPEELEKNEEMKVEASSIEESKEENNLDNKVEEKINNDENEKEEN